MGNTQSIDADTRDRLLRRIGLAALPAADAAGLRTVQRAFVSHVPFEDLAVQLGESAPLDPEVLVERVLQGGRGGYCFEVNTVLLTLLEALGFEVERRQAIVGPRTAHADGEPTNHLALVAHTPTGESFIVEGGWGEGPLEPLPLAAGPAGVGPFAVEVERDGDGWWVAQHEYGSSPGYRFADAPAALADFEPQHERLSRTATSPFVETLLVQQPYDDKLVTLRARTLFVDGPGRRERLVLDDEEAFASALRDRFGIDPEALGPERIGPPLGARRGAARGARAGQPSRGGIVKLPLTGGCMCGGVRYEIDAPLGEAGYCHCTRCQRRTGTASSVGAAVEPGSWRIVQGEELLATYAPETGFKKVFCNALRLCALQPASRGRRAHLHPARDARRGSAGRVQLPPVRRLRGAVGADSRRRRYRATRSADRPKTQARCRGRSRFPPRPLPSLRRCARSSAG